MSDNWRCRTDALDGDKGLRWGHVVTDKSIGEVCFLGFASDEGVRRNQGRLGASGGPTALRRAMANLAVGKVTSLSDLGNVEVVGEELEVAQELYAITLSEAIEQCALGIGLGGGHEIAFASYRAVRLARPEDRIGIVYFDAHFDLRQDEKRTSGTPFRDILRSDVNANAFAIGISAPANTRKLHEEAGELRVSTWFDHEVESQHFNQLAQWLGSVDSLYISFDLDVLPAHEAPGVSAPAGLGVAYRTLRPILRSLAESGKLRVFDVAEMNPAYDIDGRTARLAARIIWDVVEWRI